MSRCATAAPSAAAWPKPILPATTGAVVLGLNAQMKCAGLGGERVIPAGDFFTFAYTTALRTDEMLTEVILPTPQTAPEFI